MSSHKVKSLSNRSTSTDSSSSKSDDYRITFDRKPPPKPELTGDLIKDTFNHHYPGKTIKPIQYDIVKSILEGHDTLAILPTGYGKSLCYQLPFLINQNKIVLVISPLISLMEDQKDKLVKMNIPVACFHSNLSKKKKQDIKEDIYEDPDCGMVIFVTPEYITKAETWLSNLTQTNKLLMIAIDEAHCISTWGHDFRPDYKNMSNLKEWAPNVPILALTATATKQVETDIKAIIQLYNPAIYKTSFDRPNLLINLEKKPSEISDIYSLLDKYKEDFTIIYCKTRTIAEDINSKLDSDGYNVGLYHGGMSAKERNTIQDDFTNKKLNIIVATVAFGMGIDQNIHLVIHWGCPSNMESYYQEIGRAGRDGVISECYLYYDKRDFAVSRYFLKSIEDPSYRKFKDEEISKMERFCLFSDCRRKSILKHFGEKLSGNYRCDKCDNCSKTKEVNSVIVDNLLYPIYIIVKTIFLTNGKLGLNKLYLIVKGSKSKQITDFNKLSTYGKLSSLTEEQIKDIVTILKINGYLRDRSLSSGFGSVIETTATIVTWYRNILSKTSKLDQSYDNLEPFLQSYDLHLEIPNNFSNLSKIKFTSTVQELIEEFMDV